MNPRIRELAEQAGADFMRRINYNNLEGNEYEEDAGVIFDSNDSFEKFAELIVRECAEVADRERPTSLGCGYITKTKGMLIKEYFGVKK